MRPTPAEPRAVGRPCHAPAPPASGALPKGALGPAGGRWVVPWCRSHASGTGVPREAVGRCRFPGAGAAGPAVGHPPLTGCPGRYEGRRGRGGSPPRPWSIRPMPGPRYPGIGLPASWPPWGPGGVVRAPPAAPPQLAWGERTSPRTERPPVGVGPSEPGCGPVWPCAGAPPLRGVAPPAVCRPAACRCARGACPLVLGTSRAARPVADASSRSASTRRRTRRAPRMDGGARSKRLRSKLRSPPTG